MRCKDHRLHCPPVGGGVESLPLGEMVNGPKSRSTVECTSHGHATSVFGLRRRSVPKTRVFSCALHAFVCRDVILYSLSIDLMPPPVDVDPCDQLPAFVRPNVTHMRQLLSRRHIAPSADPIPRDRYTAT
jgi:hypothetical protein